MTSVATACGWRLSEGAVPVTMEALMTPLRQRMLEDMQIRNLSPNTQASYVQQVSLFARHFGKSPLELSPDDIRTYQIYLTNERKLTPQSILIAVSAIRFPYRLESADFSVI